MSEFTLPSNSKIGEGKHWALPQPADHVKSFRIYRWDPAKERQPDDGHL
jgi:succinate dehydrogenase / fumarate reductase, iron-sulfur subunit